MPRSPRSKNTAQTPATRRSAWQTVWRTIALVIDLCVGTALILTAFAGNISPLKHGGIWGVLPLLFPACIIATVVLLIAQLFWHRRGAIVLGVAMLICGGPILDFAPLNFRHYKPKAGDTEFNLMSFNVHNFLRPGTKANTDTTDNAIVDYIIAADADIVCLQEATFLGTIRKGYLTAAQAAKLHDAYPHVHTNASELAVLSKYPLEAIHLDDAKEFKGGNVSCFRVTLPSGKLLTLFNVHLASMRLNDDDRSLYVGLTELHRQGIGDLKEQLIDKLSSAAVARGRHAQQLMRYIRLYGGPNVIVTGDFNDVPGCYTIRTLADAGFRSAYSDAALGPTATFNQSRLYFRIDHTLYRGDVHPIDVHRGEKPLSDHYPLFTTFVVSN